MVRAGAAVRSRLGRPALEVLGLALVAYVPFLLSSPGQVAVDSKQYLYLDPSRFLAKIAYLWDHTVAAGTVTHQHIGFLWPMGPWFWLAEQLGMPDWVAQRLWMGTLTFLAAVGTRWLLRNLGVGPTGAVVGALLYALSPYQLAYVARFSDLLLPWAGLPWMVELTRRAVNRGGWRHPALLALVIMSVSGVNASSVLLVAAGPLLVLVVHAVHGRTALREALGTALRIGALVLPTSAWWIAGLRLQAAYALPVLHITEKLETVAIWSEPDDVLRGLGNWIFYGIDRLGYSLDQAAPYLEDRPLVVASFLVPTLALVAALVVRWRHRPLAVALVLVGVVVAVGAWPYESPSIYGRVFRFLAEETTSGLAFRNSPRSVPLVLLGFAMVIGAAITALRHDRLRRAVAVTSVLVIVAAIGPVWTGGYLSERLQRPEDLPDHWVEAVEALDAGDHGTRILEIPGANFSAYRWGNTVEPITPGLTDRPYIAREVLPYGSEASATFLDAIDRRIQQGTFEPQSLPPMARLLGVGDVVVRSDLEYERFGLLDPARLWTALLDPPPGLGEPTTFGPTVARAEADALDPLDAQDLASDASTARPPAVGIFPVEDPRPIVRVAPTDGPVVVAGDADGLVDAAAAGLLDGQALVLQSAALDDDTLTAALDADADLILTDTNRRRIQTWFFTLRDTRGPTEQEGETLPEPSGYDARLDPLAAAGDDGRSVVRQVGGSATATTSGGGERPESRAALAVDGDVRTAWEVTTPWPQGARWTVEPDEPVSVDRVALVQPLGGARDRTITSVRVDLGDGAPLDVVLDERSLTSSGQEVTFPRRTVDRLTVEILTVSGDPPPPGRIQPVGLAEVRLDDVQVAEVVRLPVSLLDRAGSASDRLALDVVLTRLRTDPAAADRRDEELAVDRLVELPSRREFGLTGTARISPGAPDAVLDEVLGTPDDVSVTASSRLAGDLGARASSALDGDESTAWVASTGPQEGTWIEVASTTGIRTDTLGLVVVADGRHSVPTRIRVVADGQEVGVFDLPEVPDGEEPGATARLEVPVDPIDATTLRVVVDEVRRAASPSTDDAPAATLPVGIAEVELGGVEPTVAAPAIDTGCRDDLLALDGEPIAVRVAGPATAARTGLEIELCGDGVVLAAGERRLAARPGLDTGIDLDRLVLSSAPGGSVGTAAVRGTPVDEGDAQVADVEQGRVDVRATIDSADGEPFWMVLGQSANPGWEIEVEGGTAGPRQLVDGYANGWVVTPDGPGTVQVTVRWTPQRLVWVGIGISVLGVLACVALVLRTRPLVAEGERRALLRDRPELRRPFGTSVDRTAGVMRSGVAGLLAGATMLVVADPLVGAACAVAAATLSWWRPAWWLALLGVPVTILAARVLERPSLAWVAVGLVVADVVARVVSERSGRLRP